MYITVQYETREICKKGFHLSEYNISLTRNDILNWIVWKMSKWLLLLSTKAAAEHIKMQCSNSVIITRHSALYDMYFMIISMQCRADVTALYVLYSLIVSVAVCVCVYVDLCL